MRLPQNIQEFEEIWCLDFEFSAPAGEQPYPLCLVAQEVKSGRHIRLWRDELITRREAPFSVDKTSLAVAYYSSAEWGCFLSLGWRLPVFVLDLFTEFRNLTNGFHLVCGRGLVGALTFCGLDSIGVDEKEEMRNLALRGEPYRAEEQHALLEYCAGDVDALVRLLPRIAPAINLPFALCRGRYMKAIARIEHAGVPIDVATWQRMTERWQSIKRGVIEECDTAGIYEGVTFKQAAWQEWTAEHAPEWPRLPSGRVALDSDTFSAMARKYPAVAPYREVRSAIAQLRLNDLAVGQDGRNRHILSAFGATSGRNTPSNSRFIFGPSKWLRGLIKPEEGRAIAYLDWSQQEFAIAAVLSNDSNMIAAYESGDVYLAFAKQAGAVPPDATKESHGEARALFKLCVLATQYGQEAPALAARIGKSEYVARDLLRQHRQVFAKFWEWSDAVLDHAMMRGELHTVFGWRILLTEGGSNPRSLRNFPMQANGAEMLRLACSLATEKGVMVCAPVHDAILVEAAADEIDQAIAATRQAMDEASQAVLSGFTTRIGQQVFAYPERFKDESGGAMWDRVMSILETGEVHSNI